MEDSKLSELYKLSIKQFNELRNSNNEDARLSKEILLDDTRNKIEDRLTELIAKEVSNEDDEELGFYPELLDKDFNTKIYNKKEFNDYRAKPLGDNICDKNLGSFSLSNPQMLVKNYVSPHTPYNGLLLWWGVGIGKTCAAISIAEGFVSENSDRFKGRKTIIITSGETLNGQWRKAIFDPSREDKKVDKTINVQCSGDNYTNVYNSKLKVKRLKRQKVDDRAKEVLGNALVNKNYNFYGYEKFANDYEKYEEQALLLKPKTMTSEEAKILMIKDVFSNRVIIIDEAHNTNPQLVKKHEQKISPCIKKILRYSENTKLILLSATPINNSPRDIIWLLNLLLLNDKRGTLDPNEIFNREGDFKNEKMRELFLRKATGYISYIRSENPLSYPLRISPYKNLAKEVGGTIRPRKTKLQYRCYYPYTTSPSSVNDVIHLDEERETKIYKYLQLVENPLELFQYANYLASINENSKELVTFRKSIKDTVGRIGLIMVYPTPSDSDTPHEFLGDASLAGFKSCFRKRGTSDSTIYEYKSFCEDFLKRENIERYSKKFANIYDCIVSSSGIVFVHIPYKETAKTFCMMLEEGGYTRWSDTKSKKRNFLKTDTKPNGVKYLFLTGDTQNTTKKFLNDGIAKLNQNTNINGEEIKVVITTDVAKEGLNFFNVREIHLTSPWFHLNRLEQIIGRGMRNCSHKNLVEGERNVTIYYHAGTVPAGYCKSASGSRVKSPDDFSDRRTWNWDNVAPITETLKQTLPDNKLAKKLNAAGTVKLLLGETFDEYMYWYAIDKAKTIAPLERALKKRAFDCNLNKLANVNTATKYDKKNGKRLVTTAQGVEYKQELYDTDNSQICDFMECEYTCDNDVDKTKSVNMDTYNLRYAKNDIESVKTYIKGMFSVGFVYSLDDIKNYINDITRNSDIDELYIFYALDKFVKERITIYDSYNRPGYLLYVPNNKNDTYYIFQPYEIVDPVLSSNLRDKPISKTDKTKKITVKSSSKSVSKKSSKEKTVENVLNNQYNTLLEKLKGDKLITQNLNADGSLKSKKISVSKIDIMDDITNGDFSKHLEQILKFKIIDTMSQEQILEGLREGDEFIVDYLKPLSHSQLFAVPNYNDISVNLYVKDDDELREADFNEPVVKKIRKKNDVFKIKGENITFLKVPEDSKYGFEYDGVKHPRDKKNIYKISAYGYYGIEVKQRDKFLIKETLIASKKGDTYKTLKKNSDIRKDLKGSICQSNRDKRKLSSMLISMCEGDRIHFGKLPDKPKSNNNKNIYIRQKKNNAYHFVKLGKPECCVLIELLALYNRVRKGLLHYRYKYENEDFKLVTDTV